MLFYMGSKQSCVSPTQPGQIEVSLSPHCNIPLPVLCPQNNTTPLKEQDLCTGLFPRDLKWTIRSYNNQAKVLHSQKRVGKEEGTEKRPVSQR